jgi:hypothetical protein
MMGPYVELTEVWSVLISLIFILAMSLVLWNSGLLGGLRRYGEIGVRLAMGEEKRHVYGSMIIESVFIGLAGSVIGTISDCPLHGSSRLWDRYFRDDGRIIHHDAFRDSHPHYPARLLPGLYSRGFLYSFGHCPGRNRHLQKANCQIIQRTGSIIVLAQNANCCVMLVFKTASSRILTGLLFFSHRKPCTCRFLMQQKHELTLITSTYEKITFPIIIAAQQPLVNPMPTPFLKG